MAEQSNSRSRVGHSHAHVRRDFGAAFAVGTVLNLSYVLVQVVFGIAAHSLALIADAAHNFGDVLGLLLAWWASYLITTRPTARRTYGLGRSSILAALANAILLLVAVGGITWEAIRRFANPEEVAGKTVIVVAAVGVIINGLTAMLFFSGRKRDLNVKGAFVHMAADAAVSAGVVVAALLIIFTGWQLIDPIASLVINIVIVCATWALLRDSLAMVLDIVPESVDPVAVREFLAAQPGVTAVHDLHIWALSTTKTALSAHLVKPDAEMDDQMLLCISEELHHRFGIGHATIQVERGDSADPCPQTQHHR